MSDKSLNNQSDDQTQFNESYFNFNAHHPMGFITTECNDSHQSHDGNMPQRGGTVVPILSNLSQLQPNHKPSAGSLSVASQPETAPLLPLAAKLSLNADSPPSTHQEDMLSVSNNVGMLNNSIPRIEEPSNTSMDGGLPPPPPPPPPHHTEEPAKKAEQLQKSHPPPSANSGKSKSQEGKQQQQQGADVAKNRNVFVAGLSAVWNEASLHSFFSRYGPVVSVRHVPTRRFGFVQFQNAEDADRAMRCGASDAGVHVSRSMHDEAEAGESSDNSSDDEEGKQPRNRLFLRGLPSWATVDSLRRLCAGMGTVKDCSVLVSPRGHCKGSGFVQFEDAAVAKSIKKGERQVLFDGWTGKVTAKYCETDEARQQRQSRNRERKKVLHNQRVAQMALVQARGAQQQSLAQHQPLPPPPPPPPAPQYALPPPPPPPTVQQQPTNVIVHHYHVNPTHPQQIAQTYYTPPGNAGAFYTAPPPQHIAPDPQMYVQQHHHHHVHHHHVHHVPAGYHPGAAMPPQQQQYSPQPYAATAAAPAMGHPAYMWPNRPTAQPAVVVQQQQQQSVVMMNYALPVQPERPSSGDLLFQYFVKQTSGNPQAGFSQQILESILQSFGVSSIERLWMMERDPATGCEQCAVRLAESGHHKIVKQMMLAGLVLKTGPEEGVLQAQIFP